MSKFNYKRKKQSFKEKRNRNEITITGIFRGTGKGFAFLTPDDGGEDIFIPPCNLGNALNGDHVVALVSKGSDGRREAEVIDVISQTTVYVVGTFSIGSNGKLIILPDDGKVCRLFVISDLCGFKPKEGYKVVGLPEYRDGDVLGGRLVEVLGQPNAKNVDMLSVARSFGLMEEFPPEVQAVARNMPFEIKGKSFEKREDFRQDNIITVDGVDAKDLDDAINVKRTSNGFVLSVHIADVSHYVKENGVIDREAYKRGTSVYFPGCVFPMLPRELSNGICSLNEGVDRYTMSCIMRISKNGTIADVRVCRGIIRNKHRMNYDEVQDIIDGNEEMRSRYSDVCEMIDDAYALSKILSEKRANRGGIEFELPEPEFALDENGKCIDVKLHERKLSHIMIEEFMLAANESVADIFDKLKVSFVYRVHEKPPTEKEEAFIEYLSTLGIKFDGGNSYDYAKLFESIKDSPNERAISRIGLRSMSKAKYMTKDAGHFGLALQHYCHFTSPIRRYPDLQIHRIISVYLSKRGSGESSAIKHFGKIVEESARQSSVREQVAMTAERKVDDLKKAEYMSDKVGQKFSGIVSSVTEWGLYVELPNSVEGLIRKESLGVDVAYNEKTHTLCVDGIVFAIGKKVEVVCESVSGAKINFKLA